MEDAPSGEERPEVARKAPTVQEDILSGSGALVPGSSRPKPYHLVLCTGDGKPITDADRASQDPDVAMALLYSLALSEDMKDIFKDCSLIFSSLSQHIVQVSRA